MWRPFIAICSLSATGAALELLQKKPLTFGAEWPVVGRVGAVAQVAVVLLHALPPVPAVHAEAGAVALAAGLHPGRHLGPLLQVQGDAVHPQRPDAAQEAPLAAGGTWTRWRTDKEMEEAEEEGGGGSQQPFPSLPQTS